MKSILFYLICLLLFSCSSKHENKGTIYCVIKHPEKHKPAETFNLPRPPEIFYGNFNFILIDSSKVFYFGRNRIRELCGTGADRSKPEKMNLTPEEFKEVKTKDLPIFLKHLPIDQIKKYESPSGSISSSKDTIRNSAFKIIYDYFMSHGVKYFAIRNLTEEEQYVSQAKIENKKYDPDKIEWKTGFGGRVIKVPEQGN